MRNQVNARSKMESNLGILQRPAAYDTIDIFIEVGTPIWCSKNVLEGREETAKRVKWYKKDNKLEDDYETNRTSKTIVVEVIKQGKSLSDRKHKVRSIYLSQQNRLEIIKEREATTDDTWCKAGRRVPCWMGSIWWRGQSSPQWKAPERTTKCAGQEH